MSSTTIATLLPMVSMTKELSFLNSFKALASFLVMLCLEARTFWNPAIFCSKFFQYLGLSFWQTYSTAMSNYHFGKCSGSMLELGHLTRRYSWAFMSGMLDRFLTHLALVVLVVVIVVAVEIVVVSALIL